MLQNRGNYLEFPELMKEALLIENQTGNWDKTKLREAGKIFNSFFEKEHLEVVFEKVKMLMRFFNARIIHVIEIDNYSCVSADALNKDKIFEQINLREKNHGNRPSKYQCKYQNPPGLIIDIAWMKFEEDKQFVLVIMSNSKKDADQSPFFSKRKNDPIATIPIKQITNISLQGKPGALKLCIEIKKD